MAPRLIGSVTGGSNSAPFATHTTHLLLSYPLTLHEVRFYATTSVDYDVWVGGTSVGTASATAGQVSTIVLGEPLTLRAGPALPVALVPSVPAPIRRLTTSATPRFELERLVWMHQLEETTGQLAIAFLVEGGYQPDGTGESVCAGYVDGRPHPMPGIVVNGGQGHQPAPPLPLFGRERAPGPR